jgi:hypothetical protein
MIGIMFVMVMVIGVCAIEKNQCVADQMDSMAETLANALYSMLLYIPSSHFVDGYKATAEAQSRSVPVNQNENMEIANGPDERAQTNVTPSSASDERCVQHEVECNWRCQLAFFVGGLLASCFAHKFGRRCLTLLFCLGLLLFYLIMISTVAQGLSVFVHIPGKTLEFGSTAFAYLHKQIEIFDVNLALGSTLCCFWLSWCTLKWAIEPELSWCDKSCRLCMACLGFILAVCLACVTVHAWGALLTTEDRVGPLSTLASMNSHMQILTAPQWTRLLLSCVVLCFVQQHIRATYKEHHTTYSVLLVMFLMIGFGSHSVQTTEAKCQEMVFKPIHDRVCWVQPPQVVTADPPVEPTPVTWRMSMNEFFIFIGAATEEPTPQRPTRRPPTPQRPTLNEDVYSCFRYEPTFTQYSDAMFELCNMTVTADTKRNMYRDMGLSSDADTHVLEACTVVSILTICLLRLFHCREGERKSDADVRLYVEVMELLTFWSGERSNPEQPFPTTRVVRSHVPKSARLGWTEEHYQWLRNFKGTEGTHHKHLYSHRFLAVQQNARRFPDVREFIAHLDHQDNEFKHVVMRLNM